LETVVEIDENKTGDFSDQEINEIKKLIAKHKDILEVQLDLFYSNQPVKAISK